MTQKELKREYDNLVGRIEKGRIYDGRDKGVDVYICEKCGAIKYTRYKDKGVTPFTIGCKCGCTMVHDKTISELEAVKEKATVHNWVRPPFNWLDKQRKKNKLDTINHVLNGGLVLESELFKTLIMKDKYDLEEAAREQARSFGYDSGDYEFREIVESFKAGANYVLDTFEKKLPLEDNRNLNDYGKALVCRLKELIEQLKAL